MIFGLHLEVLLALAYAAFLICLACVLELVARKSHKRAEAYRNSGFTYFRDHDYFECPAGHQLVQIDIDHRRRTVVYRAHADACNFCTLKRNCTDSESGRIVERRLDAWIESELRRFHRGISLTLFLLVTVLLGAEVIRYTEPADRKALALFLIPVVFAQFKLLPSLLSRDRYEGSQQNTSNSALPT
jgi:hypothetical protein